MKDLKATFDVWDKESYENLTNYNEFKRLLQEFEDKAKSGVASTEDAVRGLQTEILTLKAEVISIQTKNTSQEKTITELQEREKNALRANEIMDDEMQNLRQQLRRKLEAPSPAPSSSSQPLELNDRVSHLLEQLHALLYNTGDDEEHLPARIASKIFGFYHDLDFIKRLMFALVMLKYPDATASGVNDWLNNLDNNTQEAPPSHPSDEVVARSKPDSRPKDDADAALDDLAKLLKDRFGGISV